MRRLLVIGAVTGAPGVTTTALALASVWPPELDGGVRPVVVEADPSGGDLLIRFGLPSSPSLLDVAAAARQPHPGSLLGAASELPSGVRAVVAVPGRGPCREAVRLLASAAGRGVLMGDARDRGTVVLDVGRLTEDVQPLLDAADHVVLVARGGAEPLMHVSASGPGVGAYGRRPTLAVVGPCPYATEEIAQALEIGGVVFLPWDTKSVAALNGLRRTSRGAGRFRLPPLMGAARALARRVVNPEEQQTGPVGAHSGRVPEGFPPRRWDSSLGPLAAAPEGQEARL